jgi:hypothetical protein
MLVLLKVIRLRDGVYLDRKPACHDDCARAETLAVEQARALESLGCRCFLTRCGRTGAVRHYAIVSQHPPAMDRQKKTGGNQVLLLSNPTCWWWKTTLQSLLPYDVEVKVWNEGGGWQEDAEQPEVVLRQVLVPTGTAFDVVVLYDGVGVSDGEHHQGWLRRESRHPLW